MNQEPASRKCISIIYKNHLKLKNPEIRINLKRILQVAIYGIKTMSSTVSVEIDL